MDISFKVGSNVFNLRSAAILIQANKVLLQKAEADNFWAIPGGRCKVLENTYDATKREFLEEVGIEINVERLVWVVENYFCYSGAHFHEVGFYYLANSEEVFKSKGSFQGKEGSQNLTFKWFDLDSLYRIDIKPEFLKTRLTNLPDFTDRIVVNDIKR